ncbi:hypothetical protein GGR51DRAFT_503215 [Nemania sp. FL0031]|nr:hypothetical protein GGR51DRAFT_503215 [Nemania sp. FL0031]
MSLHQYPLSGAAQPFTVGITGGGLYNSGLDYNSAALLKDALPDSLIRQGRPDIRILKVTENLRSEYEASRRIISSMWDGNISLYDPTSTSGERINLQLIIHMGMRTSESNYCFEVIARKDGYVHPDNCGDLPKSSEYEDGGRLYGVPDQLRPELDIESAAQAVKDKLPRHNTRVSTDAGHNLCEWFFFNSLAEGYRRSAPLHVAFVHIPKGKSEDDLKTGVEILESFIGTLVQQIEEKEVDKKAREDTQMFEHQS